MGEKQSHLVALLIMPFASLSLACSLLLFFFSRFSFPFSLCSFLFVFLPLHFCLCTFAFAFSFSCFHFPFFLFSFFAFRLFFFLVPFLFSLLFLLSVHLLSQFLGSPTAISSSFHVFFSSFTVLQLSDSLLFFRFLPFAFAFFLFIVSFFLRFCSLSFVSFLFFSFLFLSFLFFSSLGLGSLPCSGTCSLRIVHRAIFISSLLSLFSPCLFPFLFSLSPFLSPTAFLTCCQYPSSSRSDFSVIYFQIDIASCECWTRHDRLAKPLVL